LVHADAPSSLYCPAGHRYTVALVARLSGHAYPALQLVHDAAPAVLYLPGAHAAAVALLEPALQE
jgi:hypothetical protein